METKKQQKMKTHCPFCCGDAYVFEVVGDFRERWGVGCELEGCPAAFDINAAYYIQREAAVNRWEDRACPQED